MDKNIISYNCGGYDEFFRKISKKLYKINVIGYTIPSYLRKILKDVYRDNWDNSKEYGGVYNTNNVNDYKGRSLVNYVDTHYTSLCMLITWINKQIYDKNITGYEQLDFYQPTWNDEILNFYNILEQYKFYIFNNDSEILNSMLKVISKTSNIGNYAEIETVKRLKEKGIYDIKRSKFGEVDDWTNGIDITFSYHTHKNMTVQTKSYIRIELVNDYYIIYNISNLRYYDPKIINFFSFYNKSQGFYFFDNDSNVKYVGDNNLKIHKNNKRNFRK